MKLQELLNNLNLDLGQSQIKAFFLGALSAQKPLPFSKATDELLAEFPEALNDLKPDLEALWSDLQSNLDISLLDLFKETSDLKDYLHQAMEQLDYFLTALSIAGTNSETVKDEELADILEELEETVLDLDEYLSESSATTERGEELKEHLQEVWKVFNESRQ